MSTIESASGTSASGTGSSRAHRKKKLKKLSTSERGGKEIKRFRGFSTSISSLFLDEQVVCGAVAWCGLLASARTEHLLNVRNSSRRMSDKGYREPSKILSIALIISIVLLSITYFVWGFENGDSNASNGYYNYYYNHNRVRNLDMEKGNLSLPISTLGIMKIRDYDTWVWGPVKKLIQNELKDPTEVDVVETHQYDTRLLESFTQNQEVAWNIRYAILFIFFVLLGVVGRRRRMRTRYAILKARSTDDRTRRWSSHRGLVREDAYEGACSHTLCGCYPIDDKQDEEHEMSDDRDSVNKGYRFFSSTCCGRWCNCWFQCFSICALAQEAREARLLVPPKLQRLDFITHQPFDAYYEHIYLLRRGWKGMLESDNSATIGMHLRALSTLSRYILFTFMISTTAIIFTELYNPLAEFSLADALVLIMTFAQSFLVLGIVHGIFHKSDLSLDAVIKFFATGFIVAFPTAFILEGIVINCTLAVVYSFDAILRFCIRNAYTDWIDDHYLFFLIMGECIQGFVFAATVEEICKYFAFRTVEHPDLLFLTGLDKYKQDKRAFNGGLASYPFSSDNASQLSCRSSNFESAFESSRTKSFNSHRGKNSSSEETPEIFDFEECEDKRDTEPEVRTCTQRASAVTTAMISCAVGLSCAENFVYVFFLDADNAKEEMIMLLFRSVFPIHALCAAMQSIGVIKKFVEEDSEGRRQTGVGKIVLPAILLHGCFDTVLLLLNSYIDYYWDKDRNGYSPATVNIIGAAIVVGVMLIGVIWYLTQNRSQKSRLRIEDLSSPVQLVNGNGDYVNPKLEGVEMT